MSRSFFVAVFSLALAATTWLGGCARTNNTDLMGNTNWLHACDADADCVSGALCACGVCTRRCESDTGCDGLDDAICDPAPSSEACGELPGGVDAVCLARCERDGDCADDGQCVGGTCVVGAPREHDAATPSDPFALTRDGAEVEIGEVYTQCEQHSDCILVSIGCDGCCQPGAVLRQHEQTYYDNFELACRDYMGGICDCAPPDVVARCDDGRCKAVDRAAVTDCFTPTRNVETAYDDGAVGCLCSEPEQAICVGPAALVCTSTNGSGRNAWHGVEDGPCEPRDPDCADGTITQSAEQCLSLFVDCYELESGEFCGTLSAL